MSSPTTFITLEQVCFTTLADIFPISMKLITIESYFILYTGVDEHLEERILNPASLDGIASTFKDLKSVLQSTATSATAWVGESGGAYNSGRHLVSDTFLYSFWLVLTPHDFDTFRVGSLELFWLMLMHHKQVFGSAWHVGFLRHQNILQTDFDWRKLWFTKYYYFPTEPGLL